MSEAENTPLIPLGEILTGEEIDRAWSLYLLMSHGLAQESFATVCAREIIEPVLPRINARLGQENKAKYLAYMVEHVFMLTHGSFDG